MQDPLTIDYNVLTSRLLPRMTKYWHRKVFTMKSLLVALELPDVLGAVPPCQMAQLKAVVAILYDLGFKEVVEQSSRLVYRESDAHFPAGHYRETINYVDAYSFGLGK